MDLDIMRNEMKQGAEKILVGDTFSNLLAFRRIYDETIIKVLNNKDKDTNADNFRKMMEGLTRAMADFNRAEHCYPQFILTAYNINKLTADIDKEYETTLNIEYRTEKDITNNVIEYVKKNNTFGDKNTSFLSMLETLKTESDNLFKQFMRMFEGTEEIES